MVWDDEIGKNASPVTKYLNQNKKYPKLLFQFKNCLISISIRYLRQGFYRQKAPSRQQ